MTVKPDEIKISKETLETIIEIEKLIKKQIENKFFNKKKILGSIKIFKPIEKSLLAELKKRFLNAKWKKAKFSKKDNIPHPMRLSLAYRNCPNNGFYTEIIFNLKR